MLPWYGYMILKRFGIYWGEIGKMTQYIVTIFNNFILFLLFLIYFCWFIK